MVLYGSVEVVRAYFRHTSEAPKYVANLRSADFISADPSYNQGEKTVAWCGETISNQAYSFPCRKGMSHVLEPT